MMERNEDRRWRIQFDDLPDMVRYAQSAPKKWRMGASRTNSSSTSWDLGCGYEGALRLARDGWPEGIAKLSALAAVVPNNRTYVRSYDVAGEWADVPRAIVGNPFNMVRRGKVKTAKPVVSIVVDCMVSGATSASAIANYGAAVAALIDRLETRGVRVELLIGFAGNMNGGRLSVVWHAKRAQDHLDMNAVAFGLAHPAMFRRIGFAVYERSPPQMETSGYGSCSTLKAADVLDLPANALIIGGLGAGSGHGCASMDTALEYAKKQINAAAMLQYGEPLAALELEAA